jgi:hypothetical protein
VTNAVEEIMRYGYDGIPMTNLKEEDAVAVKCVQWARQTIE